MHSPGTQARLAEVVAAFNAGSMDEDRCAEHKKLERIDAAFREGDLDSLRAAVDDPALIPNGRMPDTIGPCLTYAIYRSPLRFIRTLLEIGADPNAPAEDGFPAVIAALSCARTPRCATGRTHVPEILRLLLSFGADPNQRGINDYTPLHMAVAQQDALATQILLDAGADPDLRTRIDNYETPLDMAEAAGLEIISAILGRRGKPVGQRLRSGLTLLTDIPGSGELVRRQHIYRVRLRLWLKGGNPVRWDTSPGPLGVGRLDDNNETLVAEFRIDRRTLVSGLFYGVQGMRVGGTRRLAIAPHMAYGDRGVSGVIPPRAVLTAEITIIEGRGLAPEER